MLILTFAHSTPMDEEVLDRRISLFTCQLPDSIHHPSRFEPTPKHDKSYEFAPKKYGFTLLDTYVPAGQSNQTNAWSMGKSVLYKAVFSFWVKFLGLICRSAKLAVTTWAVAIT